MTCRMGCPIANNWPELGRGSGQAGGQGEEGGHRQGARPQGHLAISASDAAFAAQPKGRSQGGLACMVAHPDVLEKTAPVCLLEGQSMKIQLVVRCSMSAELSMAAESFEHGDFICAALAEVLYADFTLRTWKGYASRWKHYLVIDAKTGYDVLASEVQTSDRKILIDAAVLRQALIEEGSGNFVRFELHLAQIGIANALAGPSWGIVQMLCT
eukprot:g3069.t1